MTQADQPELPELIIEAGRTERRYWADLWRYRELFFFLAWRDVVVRYKQTIIGITWALIRPLLTMVVLTVIFGYVAGMAEGQGGAYFIMVFLGTLPWEFFSSALSQASESLVANARLLTKVYFPRLLIPLGTMGVSIVDFLIAFVVLLGMMAWVPIVPTWRAAAIIFFLLLGFLAALGIGLWMAALNVAYRDFRFVIPILLRLGFFISPVGYTTAKFHNFFINHGIEHLFILYYLNPVAAVIDGFRWALLDPAEHPIYWPGTGLAICVTMVAVGTGIMFFRKTERTFADIV